MRLHRLTVQNFRCFREPTVIDFSDITAIIGKNDAGKSSILDALAIFFEEAKIESDDGCMQGERSNVRVKCEFDDLPADLIVDRDFPTNLQDEYLLNEEGRLEIVKVYDCSLQTPKMTGTYAHALHPQADRRGDLLSLKITDLKERAEDLHVDLTAEDKRKCATIRRAIWRSAADLQIGPAEIPLTDEQGKSIWEQIRKEMPVFALFKSDRKSTDQDDEAQDPLKAAVDEALKEKESALKEISDFVETQVREIADRTVAKIREMDPKLASQLNPQFASPNWKSIFKISLTGDEQIPINKRGSGVRRMILLNFFRAKAEQKATQAGGAGIVYGIEELETSQHPNNQRLLLDAFSDLSALPNCQVILTTHTPVLARLLPVDSLRYLDIMEDGNRAIYSGMDTVERVSKSLGVLAEHDVKIFIGIEGKHDENFLRVISRILHDAGEDVPDLNSMTQSGEIIFFPLCGSNLALWSSGRLAPLKRPEFHLFDRDEGEKTRQHQEEADKVNQRRGCKAMLTGKREMENYLHTEAIREAMPEVNIRFGDDDDVAALAAKAIHEAASGTDPWDSLPDKKKKDKESAAKGWLNNAAVGKMTAARLTESDSQGDVRGWLREIQSMIRQQDTS